MAYFVWSPVTLVDKQLYPSENLLKFSSFSLGKCTYTCLVNFGGSFRGLWFRMHCFPGCLLFCLPPDYYPYLNGFMAKG